MMVQQYGTKSTLKNFLLTKKKKKDVFKCRNPKLGFFESIHDVKRIVIDEI